MQKLGNNRQKKKKQHYIPRFYLESFASQIKPDELSKNVKDQLELWLKSFLNYVRQTRNKVGHPAGKEMTREESHRMLLIFPLYLKYLAELLNHFKSNPIT